MMENGKNQMKKIIKFLPACCGFGCRDWVMAGFSLSFVVLAWADHVV